MATKKRKKPVETLRMIALVRRPDGVRMVTADVPLTVEAEVSPPKDIDVAVARAVTELERMVVHR